VPRNRISVPSADAPLSPSVNYRTIPECPKCGGHADKEGSPCRGYVSLPFLEHGGWYITAYACDVCAFGERIRKMGYLSLSDLRKPYPRGLTWVQLENLCQMASADTPTLLEAAQRVAEPCGRSQIIAAVQDMMQQERLGSWDQ
jgi:hypothetical protein